MEKWKVNLWGEKEKEPTLQEKKTRSRGRDGNVMCLERKTQTEYRRAFSETQLLDVTPEFKEGYQYNYITAGDVDALSYLKLILRAQNLEYCLLSTWVIAEDDILQLRDWLIEGKIKHLDCYVGEIFKNSYRKEWDKLSGLMEEFGGRLVLFRNHSKTFAGYGEKFYFGIQTSANINTNPRTEQGCITIEKNIFDFYKEYFDGINSFV